jgi:hypothetical protein
LSMVERSSRKLQHRASERVAPRGRFVVEFACLRSPRPGGAFDLTKRGLEYSVTVP